MSELERLTEIFRSLGANEPEAWAFSQTDEGINQLGRFLFLRQAWKRVLDDGDESWIDAQISYSQKAQDAPGAGTGKALERLLKMGCTREDITSVVRGMQYDLLFGLCDLIDDPGELEEPVSDISWALFQVDEDENPTAPIESLHESVLELDPTGREMRPRQESSH